jgi:hypothetical protein
MQSPLLSFLLLTALVAVIVWVIFLYTANAVRRGMSGGQLYLLRVM